MPHYLVRCETMCGDELCNECGCLRCTIKEMPAPPQLLDQLGPAFRDAPPILPEPTLPTLPPGHDPKEPRFQ